METKEMGQRSLFSSTFGVVSRWRTYIAIIVLALAGITGFTSCGESPPAGLKRIAMPAGEGANADGAPIYRNPVSITIPLDSTSNDFVFAEVLTNEEYQATERKEIWARPRAGRHYPYFTVPYEPFEIGFRDQSLQREFVIPTEELRGGSMTKYWLRFGMVRFPSAREVSPRGPARVNESMGDAVDVMSGRLVLAFRDGNREIRPMGEWTQWNAFWIAAYPEPKEIKKN